MTSNPPRIDRTGYIIGSVFAVMAVAVGALYFFGNRLPMPPPHLTATPYPDTSWDQASFLIHKAANDYVTAVKVESQSDATDALKRMHDYCGAASGLKPPATQQGQTDLTYIRQTCSIAGFPVSQQAP